MYEVKILSQFSAAHQLREHGGKCEHMHGHNWRVEVFVQGRELGEDGLLMDFHDIKAATKHVLGGIDHSFLNEVAPFDRINPSSENIARHIFESLSKTIDNDRVRISRVAAWESDTACATYSAP